MEASFVPTYAPTTQHAPTTDADVKNQRRKDGQCVSCGAQTHKVKKRHFRKKELAPLTIKGEVRRGRCLHCYPDAQNSATVPASIIPHPHPAGSATQPQVEGPPASTTSPSPLSNETNPHPSWSGLQAATQYQQTESTTVAASVTPPNYFSNPPPTLPALQPMEPDINVIATNGHDQGNTVDPGFKNCFRTKDDNGWTPLHEAMICRKSVEDVKELLELDPGATAEKDNEGNTPLHCGMNFGAPPAAIQAVLVVYPQAARQKNDDGMTPLHLGLHNTPNRFDGQVDVIMRAVPAAARDKDGAGFSVLYLCVAYGMPVGFVRAVLDAHPCAVHEKDNDGNTPINAAFPQASKEVMSLVKGEMVRHRCRRGA